MVYKQHLNSIFCFSSTSHQKEYHSTWIPSPQLWASWLKFLILQLVFNASLNIQLDQWGLYTLVKLHKQYTHEKITALPSRLPLIREMFHGQRWRNDPLYQAPMVTGTTAGIFLGDFITTPCPQDPSLGSTCAKVIRFYMKVRSVHFHLCTLCASCFAHFNLSLHFCQTGGAWACLCWGAAASQGWAILHTMPKRQSHTVTPTQLYCTDLVK